MWNTDVDGLMAPSNQTSGLLPVLNINSRHRLWAVQLNRCLMLFFGAASEFKVMVSTKILHRVCARRFLTTAAD